ncbi:PaaI family thioesterase [Phaeobacter sp. HF9A]|uniref:PaaI family thioesterase n=1 Tax=Phaeobacter sp. HF9A TaxID=2721561 RepID=UPI001430B5D5|nr:PaaI family thioesterase [Phaeobacter sp. HF9A]NIZ12819.1 PaaI family thioesterase [Phaeobacter sp. HF9A]
MIEEIRNETGAQQTLGYVLTIGHEDGCARCHLDVTGAHTNRHDVLHGGIAATLLDNAMGATCSLTVDESARTPFLTISMATQFMAPVMAGTRVTATARITGGGRSILFLAADLVDETGVLIASATGVFKRARLQKGGDA